MHFTQGVLKHRFESLRGTILRSLSLVEALIDFGEEDVEDNVYEEGQSSSSPGSPYEL